MPATFDDLYAALSPTARLLAQAYGVAAPCPMGATRIYQVMAAAGVRVPGAKGLGRRISQADIRRSNSDLIAAGITVRETVVSGIPGVNAAPECALPLTRIAHAEGRLRPLLVAVQKHLPELRRTGLAEPMHLRAHLVAGDVAKIRRSHVYGPPSAAVWGFVADPFAADLLEPLPEPVRTHALEGCLAHVIETAAPPEPIMRACEGVVGEGRLLLAPDSAFIRVLQGRFDAAEAVFAALPRAVQGEKLATTALAAIRAFVAVLRGDDGEAGRRIEEALALERSGTRRRLVFPYSRAFALSLLGLVRAGTVQANELLEEILRAAEKSVAGSSREMEPVYVARAARAGSHRDPERGYRLPGIGTLWTGLAVSWHHRGGRAWPPGGQAMLSGYRDRAAENGFAWVVAECDDVLRRTATDGRAGADAGVSRHAAPGTVPLATVAEPVPEWQRRLEAIENVSRSVARQGNAASSAARRLVWILSHNRAWVAANPKEQRRAKGGGWTKGRNVALIRLAEEAESIDYLLPQDRKAATAVAAYARQVVPVGA